MRAAVILAMLPVGVFATVWGAPPAPVVAPPLVTVAVATEGVRRVAMDTRTFTARWIPVSNMPPMQLAAVRQPGEITPVESTVPVPQPRLQRAEPARRDPQDLCARHKMRKVWVSSKRWRCRR